MTATQDRATTLSDRLLGQTLQIMEASAIWLGHELGWYAALRDGGAATPDDLAARTGTAACCTASAC